jgi:hypothetical protein
MSVGLECFGIGRAKLTGKKGGMGGGEEVLASSVMHIC